MASKRQLSGGRVSGNRNRRTANYSSSAYLQGTAAPKLEPGAVPKERQPKKKPGTSRSTRANHRIRRNQERALYMDFPYVVLLTIASICTLYLCVNYLHVQSSITARLHHIEEMEARLEKLRAENDALEISINTSIDLNQIYEIATKELGMIYAKKDQVLLYDKTESEYVRQYEDIPEN